TRSGLDSELKRRSYEQNKFSGKTNTHPVTVHRGGFWATTVTSGHRLGWHGPKRTVPSSSFHPDQSQPVESPMIARKCKNRSILTQNSRSSICLIRSPIQTSKVSRGVGYPALRQTPYVALVVSAYGEICDIMLRSHVALFGVLTDPIRGVGSTGIWGDNGKYREMNKGKNYVWPDPSMRIVILENVQFTGETFPNFGRKSRSLVSGPGIRVMS
ncbi:AP2/B3-like transcriptional factor family protein, partial [Prunus dulcis]